MVNLELKLFIVAILRSNTNFGRLFPSPRTLALIDLKNRFLASRPPLSRDDGLNVSEKWICNSSAQNDNCDEIKLLKRAFYVRISGKTGGRGSYHERKRTRTTYPDIQSRFIWPRSFETLYGNGQFAG